MSGSKPIIKPNGTKRKRGHKSGADEILDDHDGEEDEEDEDISPYVPLSCSSAQSSTSSLEPRLQGDGESAVDGQGLT